MYNNFLLSKSSKVNLYPVKLVTFDRLEVDEQNVGVGSQELLTESINNWRKALRGRTSFALMLAGDEKESRQIIFKHKGLMNEFAKLKTIKDIESFAMKYGLLGVEHPESLQVNSKSPAIRATLIPSFIFTSYGFSVFEPIELWQWHINQVRKILKLYNAVRKASSDDLIYEILEVKMHTGMFGDLTEDKEVTDRYFVHWTDGELIERLPEHFEEKSILEIAQYTLAKVLESRISNGINIGVEDIISNPSTKGFMITEQRYTRYLLAAIYYDLWQNINNHKNVYICANKNCRLPFIKSGRKKYCDEACKQEAYRLRQAEKEGDE
jgi:hypothetical protein